MPVLLHAYDAGSSTLLGLRTVRHIEATPAVLDRLWNVSQFLKANTLATTFAVTASDTKKIAACLKFLEPSNRSWINLPTGNHQLDNSVSIARIALRQPLDFNGGSLFARAFPR